jgi:hypothetical protein
MAGARARALVLAAAAASALAAGCGGSRVVQAGLYFEPVSFSSPALGGPLTAGDVEIIERTARGEVAHAFAGWPIEVGRGRQGRYRVAVVPSVRDPRYRTEMFVAGQSRAMTGVGGQGAVNFSLLAAAAVACVPAGAARGDVLAAIGRGVGRAAVHEFTHQLLPTAPIHDTRDPASFEYASASRCEQYVGEMHWDLAGPLLRRRFGG